MEIDAYQHNYQAFYDEFFPNVTVEDKYLKLLQEQQEFRDACCEQNKAKMIDEGLDVLNTMIAWLAAEGVHNPLFFGYLKLTKTADKYRREGKIP